MVPDVHGALKFTFVKYTFLLQLKYKISELEDSVMYLSVALGKKDTECCSLQMV